MRSQFDTVEELRGAGEGTVLTFQRTWKPLCDLMLSRRVQASNHESRLSYQIKELGHKMDEALVAELLPFPRKNRSDAIIDNRTRLLGAARTNRTDRVYFRHQSNDERASSHNENES